MNTGLDVNGELNVSSSLLVGTSTEGTTLSYNSADNHLSLNTPLDLATSINMYVATDTSNYGQITYNYYGDNNFASSAGWDINGNMSVSGSLFVTQTGITAGIYSYVVTDNLINNGTETYVVFPLNSGSYATVYVYVPTIVASNGTVLGATGGCSCACFSGLVSYGATFSTSSNGFSIGFGTGSSGGSSCLVFGSQFYDGSGSVYITIIGSPLASAPYATTTPP